MLDDQCACRIRDLVERGFIQKWINDYTSYMSTTIGNNRECNLTSKAEDSQFPPLFASNLVGIRATIIAQHDSLNEKSRCTIIGARMSWILLEYPHMHRIETEDI